MGAGRQPLELGRLPGAPRQPRRRAGARRRRRRQDLRRGLAVRARQGAAPTGDLRVGAVETLAARYKRPVMSVLPRGLPVRRDAGLYGYERALRRVGLEPIAGVDEAGRGACAGPLVAAAVILPDGKRGEVPGLADSKLLTAKARERGHIEVLRRAPPGAGGAGGARPW